MPATPIPVYLEVGAKRVFACALDWPGWARWAKDEESALATLADYARRFAPVAAEAGLRFPTTAGDAFAVVEKVKGNASTEFGVPGVVTEADGRPLTRAGAARQAALVEAAWATFERVAAGAPASLRKGPRGGGRDRDKIVDHVLDAEVGYARKMDIRSVAHPDFRSAVIEALRRPSDGTAPYEKGWPARYAARRIAWHALDHAWEIEDRSS